MTKMICKSATICEEECDQKIPHDEDMGCMQSCCLGSSECIPAISPVAEQAPDKSICIYCGKDVEPDARTDGKYGICNKCDEALTKQICSRCGGSGLVDSPSFAQNNSSSVYKIICPECKGKAPTKEEVVSAIMHLHIEPLSKIKEIVEAYGQACFDEGVQYEIDNGYKRAPGH